MGLFSLRNNRMLPACSCSYSWWVHGDGNNPCLMTKAVREEPSSAPPLPKMLCSGTEGAQVGLTRAWGRQDAALLPWGCSLVLGGTAGLLPCTFSRETLTL